MDLKSCAYAFFDPFTLFVFTDPFSPYERVREFLLNGAPQPWTTAQQLIKELPQEEKEDLVVRTDVHPSQNT